MSEPQQGANRKLLLAHAEGSRDLVAPLRHAFEAAGFEVASASDAQPPSNDAIDQLPIRKVLRIRPARDQAVSRAPRSFS
jgi:hypothetical protein